MGLPDNHDAAGAGQFYRLHRRSRLADQHRNSRPYDLLGHIQRNSPACVDLALRERDLMEKRIANGLVQGIMPADILAGKENTAAAAENTAVNGAGSRIERLFSGKNVRQTENPFLPYLPPVSRTQLRIQSQTSVQDLVSGAAGRHRLHRLAVFLPSPVLVPRLFRSAFRAFLPLSSVSTV